MSVSLVSSSSEYIAKASENLKQAEALIQEAESHLGASTREELEAVPKIVFSHLHEARELQLQLTKPDQQLLSERIIEVQSKMHVLQDKIKKAFSLSSSSSSSSSTAVGKMPVKASSVVGSSGTTTSTEAPLRELVIGSEEMRDEVASLIRSMAPSLSLRVSADSLIQTDDENYWGRDQRVRLLDGTHLIPYSFKEHPGFKLASLFSFLPETLHLTTTVGIALGMNEVARTALLEQNTKKGISSRLSRCAIEGGNCFITKNGLGESAAILGENSLFLSMLALEEQGYFKEHEKDLRAGEMRAPSEESVKMARAINHRLRIHKLGASRELGQWFIPKVKDETLHWSMMRRPLSPEERTQLSLPPTKEAFDEDYVLAQDIEGRLALTKQVIASELEIPEKNIVYLPQAEFHIDMDVTPLPGGDVLVNEQGAIIKVLESWDETLDHSSDTSLFTRKCEKTYIKDCIGIGNFADFFAFRTTQHIREAYMKRAKSRQADYAPMETRRRTLLTAVGCRPIPVAGVFAADERILPLNFMNALVLKESSSFLYLTNGAPSSCRYLQSAFERSIPSGRIGYIRDARVILGCLEGGLHCLTWEC